MEAAPLILGKRARRRQERAEQRATEATTEEGEAAREAGCFAEALEGRPASNRPRARARRRQLLRVGQRVVVVAEGGCTGTEKRPFGPSTPFHS